MRAESRPLERGSAAWRVLTGLARAAAAYGQAGAAARLWDAAGCWPEMMGEAALRGDFDAVRACIQQARPC